MTTTQVRTLALCTSTLAFSLSASPTPAFAATESVVYTFDGVPFGRHPSSPLVKLGGRFYGVTQIGGVGGKGTVYWVTPDGRHQSIHAFMGGSDGADPEGGLVAVGATLYGTTVSGGGTGCGGAGCGTVYSITPSGTYAVLYAFQGGNDAAPDATLINLGGVFYGTTGGSSQPGIFGTVFSLTPQGKETVLYTFKDGADGTFPLSIITDGTELYGVTEGGGTGTGCGAFGCGTVFSLSTQGLKTKIYDFKNPTQGYNPFGRLLKIGNNLFGTTVDGGTQGGGTVFRVSLTGEHKVLHNFIYTDGSRPYAGLINVKGILYGTTLDGGTTASGGPGNGTVFSVTSQGDFKSVYAFLNAPDGENPSTELLNFNGTLFGTAGFGGNADNKYCRFYGCGTVFAIHP